MGEPMSAHTPGPWIIGQRSNKYKVNADSESERIQLERLGLIDFYALSVGSVSGSVALIPLDESNIENALLISAAPDMFEVLESIEAIIFGGDQEDINLMLCAGSPIRIALHEAIYKAKAK